MKYSILGFNQEKIITYSKENLKCDLTDLLLLNYIIYAQSNPNMIHIAEDGISYVWIQHKHLLEDLPILDITDGTLKNRLTKLRKMDLIESKTVTSEISRGTRTFYATTSFLHDMIYATTSFLNDVDERPRHLKMTSDNKVNNDTKVNKTLLSKDNNVQDFQFGKQKPKKESLYTKCINLIDAKTTDKEIRALFISWLNMLLEKYKDRNKTLYINVFKGKLNTIDEYDKKDWKNVIEYNLQRGYEAFYPPKNFNNAYLNESGVRCVPNMTEEDYIRQEEYLREMEEKGVQVRF